MPALPSKVDVTCPHCGATQKEPPGAISTFCRACSAHFEVHPAPAPRRMDAWPLAPHIAMRKVHCYRCGTDHSASRFARSTLCPACNAGIELHDLDFSENSSRPVDIRGTLRVRKSAHLNHSWIICTDARIEGRITGTLLCERELRISGSGKLSFRASAATTRIGPGALVELALPLTTGDLEVCGHLTGQIQCSGTVRIRRRGILRGTIEARALVVDGGGNCEASTRITTSIAPPDSRKIWA